MIIKSWESCLQTKNLSAHVWPSTPEFNILKSFYFYDKCQLIHTTFTSSHWKSSRFHAFTTFIWFTFVFLIKFIAGSSTLTSSSHTKGNFDPISGVSFFSRELKTTSSKSWLLYFFFCFVSSREERQNLSKSGNIKKSLSPNQYRQHWLDKYRQNS